MSQTNVVFFGLLVGFVVFITVKGELKSYLAVIGLEGPGGAGGLGQSGGGTSGGGGGGTSGGSNEDVRKGIPCRPGTVGCGPNGRYGGPGVIPPTTIPYPQ